MPVDYTSIGQRTKGAWVVHHGQKTASVTNASAEFPALDTAAKAASLLSHLAASDEATLEKAKVEALGKAAGLNPKLELPGLLKILADRRVIDTSTSGDVAVLGLTSAVTAQHAADVFDDQEPTKEEKASIALAELTSTAPATYSRAKEFVSDSFKISSSNADDLLLKSERIGFVDAEGRGADRVLFNGNLFRRDSLVKTQKVLSSLSVSDTSKIVELDGTLDRDACISVAQVERILGKELFDKLRAAGMYDVNEVANPLGEHAFVTRPSAFHKFNDPFVDDSFDLAKALVAALTYGMTQSSVGRGKIGMIKALLNKLIRGVSVGPATAIGEDYRVLEMKGVIRVTPARPYGYTMVLLKRDIGTMALNVLSTGETSSSNAVDRCLPGSMTGFSGPEATRSKFRAKQAEASRKLTQDVLSVLRTTGDF
ncbi:hypothetical protein [Ancylobacter terrae]|uniref:hypothetical protein n=1 Tax=Ancylobacter sp. sgz301288 TaxID=3342077 RepID=UPI00385811F5